MSQPSLISQTIAALRQLTQVNVQANWRFCNQDLPIAQAVDPQNWNTWAIAEMNAKQHLPWGKGQQVRWFGQQIVVPETLQNYPLAGLSLRLALTWWAREAQVFVNGELVQEGDLFDCAPRLLLNHSVASDEKFSIALRLISPGHDDGALVKSTCLYESLDEFPEPSFIADELAVLQIYLETFDVEKLATLESAIAEINWSVLPNREQFDRTLAAVRDRLLPFSELIKQHTIQLLGHAHLDMAWLWTVDETWKAAEQTFKSVLHLQQDFPELTFCHSTPALYEWIEQNRPELFTQIQQQVQVGKWEAIGGIWIEPELNLISGESIVRQILYGQRYFQAKIGKISPIAWLPDTFGFNWQLPQLLKQGGIDYFVTQKLRWNDTTKFPYELFWWQAPDNSQVLSLMSAPIGEGIDPIKMATYACDWESKTGIPCSLWLPGVGDHGGGPTRDMLELARRWQRSPLFPQLEFTTAEAYLQTLESAVTQNDLAENIPEFIQNSKLKTQNLPTWNDELYLEFHRGCYTTHADQKQSNRDAEAKLYEAELWVTLATIATGIFYPKVELETAWKQVLFNQFHDILPGSAIWEVYEDANQAWEAVDQTTEEIRRQAQATIAHSIALPTPPHLEAELIVVFNSLGWMRSELVAIVPNQLENTGSWQVLTLDGKAIETQEVSDDFSSPTHPLVSFVAEVPAFGYGSYWIVPCEAAIATSIQLSKEFTLENDFLRVIVDPETGDLSSIFDKIQQREILSAPGNQLQAFQDSGQYWDAWNIDPNYAQHPLPGTKLLEIQYKLKTELETQIQVDRTLGNSRFSQTYKLEKTSPMLKIDSRVVWEDRHVLVKTAFPFNLDADFATYEIPHGAIARTTKPESDREKAKWEVPALRWADLSEDNYGVSLLNDCKHGYDAQPNQLRLTLLRGAEFPDPKADQTIHEFTYAIYPHSGNWQMAQTVQRGYELNHPLVVRSFSNYAQWSEPRTRLATGQFLDLGAKNLILTAFKQSEDNANEWILRCYECHGKEAELRFHNDLGLRLDCELDLLEHPILNKKIQGQMVKVRPWAIVSFKVIKS